MKMYNKNIFGCAVVMTSFLLMSCDQSTEQASITDQQLPDTSIAAVVSKSGPTVALSSDKVSVYKGDTFTLDIMMSEFISTEGGGVTVRFDADLVQVVNVNIDSNIWKFKIKEGNIHNIEGSISDILFSSYQDVEGSAKIATVEFKSIEKGVSTITLAESEANAFAGGGEKIAVVFNSNTISSN